MTGVQTCALPICSSGAPDGQEAVGQDAAAGAEKPGQLGEQCHIFNFSLFFSRQVEHFQLVDHIYEG